MQRILYQRQKKRRPRADKGKRRWSTRHIAVLRWIGEQHAVRIDTLKKLLAHRSETKKKTLSDRWMRNIIKRWRDAKWIEDQKILTREPGWVWLTTKGLRDMGMRYYKSHPPSLQDIRHRHHLNELRCELEIRYSERLRWIASDRALKRARNQLPLRLRSRNHRVDGVIVWDNRFTIAVLFERRRKGKQRLSRILNRLTVQYPHGCWYFVNNQTETLIKGVIDQSGEKRNLFKVYHLKHLLPWYTE